jgi:hypothetical protein
MTVRLRDGRVMIPASDCQWPEFSRMQSLNQVLGFVCFMPAQSHTGVTVTVRMVAVAGGRVERWRTPSLFTLVAVNAWSTPLVYLCIPGATVSPRAKLANCDRLSLICLRPRLN